MKKNSLTILWAIIICGATFLIANKYKTANAPSPEKPETQIKQEIEAPTTQSQIPPLTQETPQTTLFNEKSYAELLKEGDSLASNFYYKSAISKYEEAISKNPNSVEALNKLAEIYLKDNAPDKARQSFQKALKLNPNSNSIKLGIARTLLNEGKTEEAKTIFWELPESFAEARYYQALSLIIYDKTSEALEIFKALQNDENIPQELKEKVEIFTKTEEEISIFAKDDNLFARLKWIYALVKAEEHTPAISKTFALLNEKNNYRDAWIVMGYAYLQTGKTNDAIDALIQAREIDSNKPETMFYLGIAYFINNEFEKSIYYLQKAESLKFRPKDLLDLKMAEVYKARNDFEKSEQKYEALLNNGYNEIFVYENLINLNLEKINNQKKAFKYAEELYKKHPDQAKTHLLLAKIYFETNNLKHAKTFINNALTKDQSIAEIYFLMGKISEKENKNTMAKEYYQMAGILNQDEEITKKSIDRINIINASISNKQYQVNLFQQ
jgi:predicted Zn-dependent protease